MTTREQQEALIEAWGDMVEDRCTAGWSPYLLSIKFDELLGGPAVKKTVMEGEIEHLYRDLLCQAFKRPHGMPSDFLPLMVALPDHPVYKWNKDMLRNIAINEGLHYHATLIVPPWARMKQDLGDYLFMRAGRRVGEFMLPPHVEPVTHDIHFVTDYAMKGLKSGRNSTDDLLIFPYSRSELGTRRERRQEAAEFRALRPSP